ncbi:hypothetical protein CYMTET_43133 [Cymbomonas tetramitiformis]|uniref:RNase H type-1 domain-containing protein n=1 Tax=Cymbomonas tetramitiformis TaxID=36881 RepID=A0AAE0C2U1_9CHLO|nr:hypothetical protein CYMTET_43133 [Cymbomonas tetramitiformis]
MEALVVAGHTVALLKVKAHTGITGNERADEAAKQACTMGTLTEAWDNNETIKVKPMLPDGNSGSRELKGKLAVQKYVTTLLREGQAQGENRLSKKTAELQGEPTTWTHQPKKEHVFRWEAQHDQATHTEEEQTIIRDPAPNPQQQADQTRDEEDRRIRDMLERQEDEEMLQIQKVGEQHEPWEEMDLTAHNQEGNPPPTEVSPQPSNEEEIFERLNELVEQQETPQEEPNEEEIFERLSELIEQQETPQGELEKRRQAHHSRGAGVTWETVVGFIVEEGGEPFHFTQQRQEELIELDLVVGQGDPVVCSQHRGGGPAEDAVIAWSLAWRVGDPGVHKGAELGGRTTGLPMLPPWATGWCMWSRTSSRIGGGMSCSFQFDDGGSCGQMDLSNSRCVVEYLYFGGWADGAFEAERARWWEPGGVHTVTAPSVRAAVLHRGLSGEPVVGVQGAGQAQGGRLPAEEAGPSPEAYEAPIMEEPALGRDLSAEELRALDSRGLMRLEREDEEEGQRWRRQRLQKHQQQWREWCQPLSLGLNKPRGGVRGPLSSRARGLPGEGQRGGCRSDGQWGVEAGALGGPGDPEASWKWLRGLQLPGIFACPFSSVRHVPKRARDDFVGAMRWVLRNLSEDHEDFWRMLGVAPRMVLAPQPGGRKKCILLGYTCWRVGGSLLGRGAVSSGVAGACLRGADYEQCHHFDEGRTAGKGDTAPCLILVFLPPYLEPQTLEALEALHPHRDGLPAPVRVAPLVLEEAVPVEAVCRQSVASEPGCSSSSLSISVSSLTPGMYGVPAIQHACEQIVSNKVPEEILLWLIDADAVCSALRGTPGAWDNLDGSPVESLKRLAMACDTVDEKDQAEKLCNVVWGELV